MKNTLKARTERFQTRLADNNIDVAVLTDEDSISWLAGFWGYLGIEFGRPSMMLVPKDGDPIVITPLMESDMVKAMTWVEDVRSWEDPRGASHWDEILSSALGGNSAKTIGLEKLKTPALISAHLDTSHSASKFADVSAILTHMRMIKSAEEIEIMRQAGQIAIAMLEGGRSALGEGVPEYEVALAIINAGTRKAAGFLTDAGLDAFISPTVHNLQVLQSGADTAMVHRRSSVKTLKHGDPVYMCFCGMVNFRQYKLGFDREYFIGSCTDEEAKTYEVCIAAQKAALDAVRPGAIAEDVHEAANEVYRSAGFSPGYRTGRAIGISNLESPELKTGDRSVLQAGMTFAVDGGITVPGKYGARVGDSIVVTEDGFEFFTPYPKELSIV
ncbi:MAG: aminopeptidase P family protein [Alphaproteobacteria bacterium]|nr:aminopeptidase P family protein [Alphaproteobacteria bacterium]